MSLNIHSFIVISLPTFPFCVHLNHLSSHCRHSHSASISIICHLIADIPILRPSQSFVVSLQTFPFCVQLNHLSSHCRHSHSASNSIICRLIADIPISASKSIHLSSHCRHSHSASNSIICHLIADIPILRPTQSFVISLQTFPFCVQLNHLSSHCRHSHSASTVVPDQNSSPCRPSDRNPTTGPGEMDRLVLPHG